MINHQWSFAWYGYCPMNDQFQIDSHYEGTLLQAELLFLFCSRDTNWVVEVVVVHFVQLYFANGLQRISIQCLQIHFSLAVALLFWYSAMLHVIKTFEQLLKLWFFHLLIIFSSWWFSFWWGASDELASDDVITSGALDFRSTFFRCVKLLYFVDSFALICSSRTYTSNRH